MGVCGLQSEVEVSVRIVVTVAFPADVRPDFLELACVGAVLSGTMVLAINVGDAAAFAVPATRRVTRRVAGIGWVVDTVRDDWCFEQCGEQIDVCDDVVAVVERGEDDGGDVVGRGVSTPIAAFAVATIVVAVIAVVVVLSWPVERHEMTVFDVGLLDE